MKTGTFNDENGDGFAQLGETIAYSFLVSNGGNVTLTNVSVTDPLVPVITCPSGNPIPSLAVGASETCSGSYSVTQADIDAGSRANVATADSAETDPVIDDETVALPQNPAIRIVKTANPTFIFEDGGTITYSYSVTNAGNVTLTNVTVIDDNATPGDNSDDFSPTFVGGDTDNDGELDLDETWTYTATRVVAAGEFNSGDEINNTAVADSDQSDPNSDNAIVQVRNIVPSEYAELTKTASPLTVLEPGGNVTFTVGLFNGSSFDTLTLQSLTDSIYNDITTIGHDGIVATDCVVPQTILPNATYTCQFTAFVDGNAGLVETDVVSATGVDDDGAAFTLTDDAVVTVTGALPAITVVKTANPNNVVAPGENVTFVIEITNDSVSTDPVTLTSLTDDIYGDILILTGEGGTIKDQVSTDCALITILPGETYTCNFVAFVGLVAGEVFGEETDTVTASGTDDEGNPVSDSDDATVTISPPISVTNSSLCIFDNDGDDTNGRQWRRLFTQDHQNMPSFKFNATNPGQFFYNLSVSGTPGEIVNITLSLPWPFVTQGARALHVYDGVSLYVNDSGETCYLPGDESQAINQVVVLGDYTTLPAGGTVTGYNPDGSPVLVDIEIQITIPSTGFAYINQHMDDGLKGRHVDADGDGLGDRYDAGLDDVAIEPGTAGNPVIVIPELVDHTFCSYIGWDSLGDTLDELGCDAVQNDNEFKKNPGVAGRGAHKPKDEFGNVDPTIVPENGEPAKDKWVKLYRPYNPKKGCDQEWCEVGRSMMDDDGYYQVVYKHKGKPTDFRMAIVVDQDSDVADPNCENSEQIVNLKGNEFEEVNFFQQPDTCRTGPSSFPGP